MKKNILVLLSVIFLFCSFSLNKTVTFKGRVASIGNIPFNYAVIYSEKGQTLKIIDGKYTSKSLLDYQGRRLEITGIITKKKTGDSTEYFIDVEDIKMIN